MLFLLHFCQEKLAFAKRILISQIYGMVASFLYYKSFYDKIPYVSTKIMSILFCEECSSKEVFSFLEFSVRTFFDSVNNADSFLQLFDNGFSWILFPIMPKCSPRHNVFTEPCIYFLIKTWIRNSKQARAPNGYSIGRETRPPHKSFSG